MDQRHKCICMYPWLGGGTVYPKGDKLSGGTDYPVTPVVTHKKFESIRKRFADVKGKAQPDGQMKLEAWWLIAQAGWKGRLKGPVGVYDKHALVLVNYGGATCAQLLSFAKDVSASVQERYGVTLEMEPVVLP